MYSLQVYLTWVCFKSLCYEIVLHYSISDLLPLIILSLLFICFFILKQHLGYNASLSYSSSCVSATEFFDAEDLPSEKAPTLYQSEINEEESEVRTRSESSSEAGSLSSGEGSVSSEESELLGTELNPPDDLDIGGG